MGGDSLAAATEAAEVAMVAVARAAAAATTACWRRRQPQWRRWRRLPRRWGVGGGGVGGCDTGGGGSVGCGERRRGTGTGSRGGGCGALDYARGGARELLWFDSRRPQRGTTPRRGTQRTCRAALARGGKACAARWSRALQIDIDAQMASHPPVPCRGHLRPQTRNQRRGLAHRRLLRRDELAERVSERASMPQQCRGRNAQAEQQKNVLDEALMPFLRPVGKRTRTVSGAWMPSTALLQQR